VNLRWRDLLANLLAQLARQGVEEDGVVMAGDVERVGERDFGGRVVLLDEGAVELLAGQRDNRNLLRLWIAAGRRSQ
jgi:hypothetical protein